MFLKVFEVAGKEAYSYSVIEWHTHFLIDSQGVHFNNRVFVIFHNDWIDCRDAFDVVLCLSKQARIRKKKSLILQPIGIIVIKSKEAR